MPLHRSLPAAAVVLLCLGSSLTAAPADYFAVRVVDQDTGRGVPLVELKTTNDVKHYTDSNGFIAFLEPGLMGQDVFFHVTSHGYEYPKDAFGFRGVRLKPTAGGRATIKVKRVNVAERLYRVTGQGVYRDSLLLGEPVPTEHPALNGQVMGQDTVMAAVYRGKIFWLWGDTNRAGYPLGNFSTTAATSELPGRPGGLDPAAGVNLYYFLDPSGFTRQMVPDSAVKGPGLKWCDGLIVLPDPAGRERLVGRCAMYKDLGTLLYRGLVVFNDETGTFDSLAKFDPSAPMILEGHPFRAETGGVTYAYNGFGPPYAVRVPADWKAVQDPAAYEGFTCLPTGGRFDGDRTKLDRGPDGKLVVAWKKGTPPLSPQQRDRLVKAGVLKADEAWAAFRDVETGKPVKPHGGSVSWSPYRRRWQTVFTQSGGTASLLGEIWYAEADTPAGPWGYARKILTHEKYTFYNPAHHPFFDQGGGRVIYFEGTYTTSFSGNPEPTPRYEYNQIMHRLDLADPRLALPAPVYRVPGEGGLAYLTREGVEGRKAWPQVRGVAFFAVPPDRPRGNLVPVYAVPDPSGFGLRTAPPADGKAEPAFLAPPDGSAAGTVPLYEFRSPSGGRRAYATRDDPPGPDWHRGDQPVCHVWAAPPGPMTFDRDVRPVVSPPPK
ncbi:MAG TPA: hypothetical protein VGF55_11350 [Gemmataceae bacterium]|jgi:hypothetical protein